MSEITFKELLGIVGSGKTLSLPQAQRAFDIMMSGEASPAQMGAFLMALRQRGETVEEITAGAMTMRAKALAIEAPADAIDTCGTGGDASGTFNISTAVSLVLAGLGVPVAKHGNRAQSSKSGAADVLKELGVNIDADMALVKKSIWEAKVGFLMAPRHHAAMKHVGPVRVDLGFRTIFNLLGPLSNPAGTKRQLVGVFAREWVEPVARVLANLGAEKAWVVHGSDGLDEITTTGPTHVAELDNGTIRTFTITPGDAGLPVASPADLKGGDAATNALALSALLDGHTGPYRDIVLMNSAAALIVAGKVKDLKGGVMVASTSIDGGKARMALNRMVDITNGKA
jgi:anthranilate phosphoribosyltransferase